jgi:hypothetical protein
MTEGPTRKRVTVTAPPRASRPVRLRPGAREIDEQTALGEVYMRSLLRTQLRLALAVLALVVVPLALLPVAFAVWPDLGRLTVGAMPLPWLLLGFVVYPWVVLVGWRYVRQVERNEREFERIVGPSR